MGELCQMKLLLPTYLWCLKFSWCVG